MLNTKVFTNAVFATVTVLSLGVTGHAASAQPMLVIRGPHGATSIVDEVPLGATVLPTAPSHDAPKLVTRGPGGAAHIVSESTETKPMAKAHSFPKLVTVGSHGAAQIAD
ncbi:hypothetical protein [Altericista sp. CCNU0014]|uniref:hypothetical protein n=1 Tax=Altericista sp. CCNU0014 TaxID=3082949 RepID=UPI00384D6531